MNSTYDKSSQQDRFFRAGPACTMRRSVFISIASLLCVAAPWATATPLPSGTILTITPTTDPNGLVPCSNGSCFGMFLAPGLYYWTGIKPGTDGGIVIGKAQLSGGQEVNGLVSTGGEITAVWNYGANWGTFFTAPSDAGNVFNDASCTGAGCGSNTTPRLTDLAVWHTAWGGQKIPMGSAAGCNKTLLPACTADQVAGIFVDTWTIDPAGSTPRNYYLKYTQIVPSQFINYPYALILRGTVTRCVGTCASLSTDKNNITTGTTATLTGTCTTDTPVTISSCLISQTSGPAATIVNTQAPTGTSYSQTRIDTFTPTQNGTYVFTLTTTDSVAATSTGSGGIVTITVSDVGTASQPSTSEGCSMVQGTTVNPSERFDWWLVLGFIAWMGLLIRRRQQVRA